MSSNSSRNSTTRGQKVQDSIAWRESPFVLNTVLGMSILIIGALFLTVSGQDVLPAGQYRQAVQDHVSTLEARAASWLTDNDTAASTNGSLQPPIEQPDIALKNLPLPTVTAESFLVADLETGQVLAAQNERAVWPIASISKLMTAVVASETVRQDELITITAGAIDTYGAAGGLLLGEKLLLGTLYYPLLLESSNDAAHAIAGHVGFDHFITMMNKKALALSMTQTHFVDPSGLSPHNVSTTVDLFRLSHYIYARHPVIFDITTTLQESRAWNRDDGLRSFTNIHPLRLHPQFAGGKNGYIPAAEFTLLSLFNVAISGESHTIAVIILQSEEPRSDTLELLSWLKRATS